MTEQTLKRREIQLHHPRCLEADAIPTEGDIVFNGCRRELVVADVPQNANHGHLIRTAYQQKGRYIENTYELKPLRRLSPTLTLLGSSEGPETSKLYHKKLADAGLLKLDV